MRTATEKEIERAMNSYYRDIAIVAGNNAIRAHIAGDLRAYNLMGIMDIRFDLVQAEALTFAKDYGNLLTKEGASIIKGKKIPWLRDHTKRTRESVFKTIEEGLKAGKPVTEIGGKKVVEGTIAYDLRELLIRDKDYEYARIARSEIARIQSKGSMSRYKTHNIRELKWLCGPDPCPICQQFCGHVFDINEVPEVPVHPNSYTKDTAAYTNEGFKLISDIKIGDSVLSLNPTSFDLEYVKVTNLVSHYQERMLSFFSHNFDVCVTPDHDMFCLRRERAHTKERGWEFIAANKIPQETRFYRSSEWTGTPKEYVEINGDKKDINAFCAFMGFWLSEGYIISTPEKHGYRIGISQSLDRNEDKYWKIYEATEKITNSNINRNNKGITFHDEAMFHYLRQFGKAHEKYIPNEIKNLPAEQIRIFLDAYVLGDGTRRKPKSFKKANFRDEVTYFTSSNKMADDIGELLIKVGRRPSYYLNKKKGLTTHFKNGDYTINQDVWVIRECYAQTSQIGETGIKIQEIEYNDIVFCVELEKNHTLYVRRNGKCAWCGNCTCDRAPVISMEPKEEWTDKKMADTLWEKTEKDGNEHAMIMNDKIFTVKGKKHSLDASKYIHELDSVGKPYLFHHTHPTWDSPFSENDISNLLFWGNMKTMVASSSKNIYKLTKTQKTPHNMDWQSIHIQFQNIEKEEFKRLKRLKPSFEEHAKIYRDSILHANKEMAKKYNCKFEVISR